LNNAIEGYFSQVQNVTFTWRFFMEKRRLGKEGFLVFEVVFAFMGFSDFSIQQKK
jgi:hypothetical protein